MLQDEVSSEFTDVNLVLVDLGLDRSGIFTVNEAADGEWLSGEFYFGLLRCCSFRCDFG